MSFVDRIVDPPVEDRQILLVTFDGPAMNVAIALFLPFQRAKTLPFQLGVVSICVPVQRRTSARPSATGLGISGTEFPMFDDIKRLVLRVVALV